MDLYSIVEGKTPQQIMTQNREFIKERFGTLFNERMIMYIL